MSVGAPLLHLVEQHLSLALLEPGQRVERDLATVPGHGRCQVDVEVEPTGHARGLLHRSGAEVERELAADQVS